MKIFQTLACSGPQRAYELIMMQTREIATYD